MRREPGNHNQKMITMMTPHREWIFLLLLVANATGFATLRPSASKHNRVQSWHLAMSTETTTPAPSESLSSSSQQQPQQQHYDAVVVGGGPAGLLSAIMLAQLPPLSSSTQLTQSRIIVYDRLPPPPSPDNLTYSTNISKYYLLGLGHRAQTALKHFNVWEPVAHASIAVVGRRDWTPGNTKEEDGNIRLADKAVTSRVIARDKLVGVLKQVIEERYSNVVDLRYGWDVNPVSFGNEEDDADALLAHDDGSGPPVTLRVSRCIPVVTPSPDEETTTINECNIDSDNIEITTNFLIGSDGTARTIANAMEANSLKTQKSKQQTPFKVQRYEDDNPRVYKSIPIQFPSHWPHNLNYSARSTNNRAALEALPSDSKGNYCALLLLRPKDTLAHAHGDPKVLREFFDEEYPQFSKLLEDDVMESVAEKGASALPGFRYAGPRLHEGRRTVLLGDCIHTVKPYYGLGANTALEDVQILHEILSATPNTSQNLDQAVQQFTKQRATDTRALVTISRGMDRPGKLGTMRFIIPLILDSMFHKIAPKIFAPSMFGMFQMEGKGFRWIQLRKRRDRVGQALVIISGMGMMGMGARCLVKSVARVLGVKDAVVGGGMAGLIGLMGFARMMLQKMGKERALRLAL